MVATGKWCFGLTDVCNEPLRSIGHSRLGGHSAIDVESACLRHPAVAECAVVGRPDELRGEVISAFVLLKHGEAASADLRRSGKLIRRVLKAVILDRDPGDITTIEDEGSVDEARAAWNRMKSELLQAEMNRHHV